MLNVSRSHHSRSMNGDRLEVFAAPDRPEPAFSKYTVIAGGYGSDADQIFACRSYNHGFKRMPVLLFQLLLGLMNTQSPETIRRQKFYLVILDFQIGRFFRLSFNNKAVISGIFQLRGKPSADIAPAVLLRIDTGAYTAGSASSAGRNTCSCRRACHVNKLVLFVKRAGSRFHFIPENPVNQVPSADIFRHIFISIYITDLLRCQVDADNFSAVSVYMHLIVRLI